MAVPIARLALTAVACLAASAALWWLAYFWAFLPFGSDAFYRVVPLLAPLTLLAIPALLLSLLLSLSRRRRRAALTWFAACAGVVGGAYLGTGLARPQRLRSIEHVPSRASALVQAIEAFERDQGRAPDRLEELVPRYLDAIPPTGLGGHPRWFYNRAPYSSHPSDAEYGDNPWLLKLFVGSRFVGSCQVLYFPDRRYPAGATRIGEWAYIGGCG
jgi:hypothetical protein